VARFEPPLFRVARELRSNLGIGPSGAEQSPAPGGTWGAPADAPMLLAGTWQFASACRRAAGAPIAAPGVSGVGRAFVVRLRIYTTQDPTAEDRRSRPASAESNLGIGPSGAEQSPAPGGTWGAPADAPMMLAGARQFASACRRAAGAPVAAPGVSGVGRAFVVRLRIYTTQHPTAEDRRSRPTAEQPNLSIAEQSPAPGGTWGVPATSADAPMLLAGTWQFASACRRAASAPVAALGVSGVGRAFVVRL